MNPETVAVIGAGRKVILGWPRNLKILRRVHTGACINLTMGRTHGLLGMPRTKSKQRRMQDPSDLREIQVGRFQTSGLLVAQLRR